MNTKITIATILISLFYFTGAAVADEQKNQLPETSSVQQSDESSEFAAYEFDTDEVKRESGDLEESNISNAGDSHEWNPESWSEIP